MTASLLKKLGPCLNIQHSETEAAAALIEAGELIRDQSPAFTESYGMASSRLCTRLRRAREDRCLPLEILLSC